MFSIKILVLSLIIFPIYAQSPTHLPLATLTIQNLGFVSDPASNANGVFHDGGGGASQNGYHVQVFADSMTYSDGFNLVHNSVAYFGLRDPKNPLNEYTFGMSGPKGNATFTGNSPVGAVHANETALGSNFSIWMLSGMTPMLDGHTVLGVFPALNQGTNTDLYTTMVQMNVTDPDEVPSGGTPPFKRLGTGRLFYPNEVQYGKFALQATIDGYLYLYGSDKTGVKLARTPHTATCLADRNFYQYWNSETHKWQRQSLKLNDKTGNLLTWSKVYWGGEASGPDVGDVWYDNYHKTTVMMWGDQWVDGTLWFSYAKDNDLTGEWSEPAAIYTPPIPAECVGLPGGFDFNYQNHAHPGWDTTGKTLLISYASCALYVSMAKITWA